nr:MAG TPA: hypothetical protein [Caudoviricetes sp.]
MNKSTFYIEWSGKTVLPLHFYFYSGNWVFHFIYVYSYKSN